MEKLRVGNRIMKIKSFCLKLCCCRVRLSVLFVHAERGTVSINTKVKSEDTESTDVKKSRRGACEQKAATVLPNRTAAT